RGQGAATVDQLDGEPAVAELQRAGEAGNAGANDNDRGFCQSILPFLRRHDPDQVQRVQPHSAVSARNLSEPDTPRTSLKLGRERPCCQAASGVTGGARCVDSPKPSQSGSPTSLS